MQRSSFRLSRSLRSVVYLSFGLLLLTGGGWMLLQGPFPLEDWPGLPRLSMQIHGAAAMLALLVLGALTSHVQRGWRAGKNRLSGLSLLALNGFLVLTGYGLYYAGGEVLREWLSRWHSWIGLATLLLLPAHVIAGRLILGRLHRQKHPSLPSSSGHRHLP